MHAFDSKFKLTVSSGIYILFEYIIYYFISLIVYFHPDHETFLIILIFNQQSVLLILNITHEHYKEKRRYTKLKEKNTPNVSKPLKSTVFQFLIYLFNIL